MAFATSKTTACVCAFCAAEMAGELIRNLSEKLPVEKACPRLWCRADIPEIGGEGGGENKKALTVINRKGLIFMVRPKRFELLTYRFVACCSIQLSYERVQRRGT